ADLSDGSHDLSHLRRVKRIALQIAARERRGDHDILIAAAYLHDLVNLPKSHPDRAQASRLSAKAARPLLAELEMTTDQIDAVCHAIEAHSFSAGIPPETIEAQILQDADRFDALGAIGIARLFYIAGSLGSQLFDQDDPFAQTRPLDDRQFALDHFEIKLFKLPDGMNTDSARALAQSRIGFLRSYLRQLRDELEDA
ncbi:HD domain-containing protein, partial [Tabrizicola sp.]|uniref:HD domain-containing protein n=1 Tax=Tabrizicola sp. TaxID=2005166 RepID=UPI003F2A5365